MVKEDRPHSFFYRCAIQSTLFPQDIDWQDWKNYDRKSRVLRKCALDAASDMCATVGHTVDYALRPGINPFNSLPCFFLRLHDVVIALNYGDISHLRWLLLNIDETETRDIQQEKASERKAMTGKLRYQVYARDGFRCVYCGKSPAQDAIELHVDHIIPIDRGGRTHIDNLVTACSDCNYAKSNTLLLSQIKAS